MKKFLVIGIILSLASSSIMAQRKTQKRIVKKIKKVRIYRSVLDLLYIPKKGHVAIKAGAETQSISQMNDYLVPPLGQAQAAFKEDIKNSIATGFLSMDYAVARGFIIGARFSHNFKNLTESKNAQNTASAFTLYEEDNAGFKDPELHALYRILYQREKGFTIDVFGNIAIGVQSAEREEGDFETTINANRGNYIPADSLTQNGNSASGGSAITLGIRSGRKHSPNFEYTVEADITFKTQRDYQLLRAYSQSALLFRDLDYNEDAQFIFHFGGIAQYNFNRHVAAYLGGDFFFNGQREFTATYPNAAVERTNIDSQTTFGAKLGVKFLVIPKKFTISLQGHYFASTDAESITIVNNTESYRYQITDRNNVGGKLEANIFF